jgi:4-hydroxy-tetrahydrodipicolinate reductase
VVAFQAAFAIMAEQFPGAFSGYKLEVTESHQSTKVDTSGTARAVVSSFRKLGVIFDDEEVILLLSQKHLYLLQLPKRV